TAVPDATTAASLAPTTSGARPATSVTPPGTGANAPRTTASGNEGATGTTSCNPGRLARSAAAASAIAGPIRFSSLIRLPGRSATVSASSGSPSLRRNSAAGANGGTCSSTGLPT